MNRRSIHRVDQVILSHCEKDQALLSELLPSFPRGTLYRHVEKLIARGLLSKLGRIYSTTEQGKRRLEEVTSQFDWNVWDQIYRPMQYIPTPQHRAVIELTTAAVVARQADGKEDHHPGFVLMGSTLGWKTSAAKFECQLLGISPSETIIDLTAETGRSLLVRRDGKGEVAFKRDLLDGQLIVLDDVLEAETSLRPTIHHLLSGRKIVPVDNALIRVAPVCFLTLNPKPKATLEEQTTFNTAQLRRLVVTNLAYAALPDLANMGHRALEEAAKQGPLRLQPPTVDAETYRSRIVGIVRQILIPKVWPRVDTEMIVTMVTGMTAFIPDPERAIQQTVYDYAITAETLGWTTPGWSDAVGRFSLHTTLPRRERDKRQSSSHEEDKDQIIIWRSAMEGYRESALPPFVISDANKARLIAVASQEGIPLEHVDHALEMILDWWNQQQRNGRTLDEVYSVLQLAKDLRQRTIAVQDVKVAMKFRQEFHDGSYTSEDFEGALNLLPTLRDHGLTAQDDRLQPVLGVAARLLNSDRSLVELDAWLKSLKSRQDNRSQGAEASGESRTDEQQ